MKDVRDLMAELHPKTREGIWRIIEQADISPSKMDGWIPFIDRLKDLDDRPEWFPSGKWATIQRMEVLVEQLHRPLVYKDGYYVLA